MFAASCRQECAVPKFKIDQGSSKRKRDDECVKERRATNTLTPGIMDYQCAHGYVSLCLYSYASAAAMERRLPY